MPVTREGLPRLEMRKNYLYLVRTHPTLAKTYGLRESDVYL